MSIAIFNELRNRGVDLQNDENILITSPDYYPSCHRFCGQNSIVGSPPSCLVDNSQTTGWASYKFDQDYQHFIVDFKTYRVALSSFMLETSCSTPREIRVMGSNNGDYWYDVAYNNTNLNFNTKYTFSTFRKSPFKMFKIEQIGKSTTEENRFVLKNIEFYGSFHKLNICTAPTTYNFQIPLTIIFILAIF